MKSLTIPIAILLVLTGAGLWLFARDTHFFWFQGGPLGVVLVVIGVLDGLGALRSSRESPQ